MFSIVSNAESYRLLSVSYYNLALCESDLGEFEKAMDSFSKSRSYTDICRVMDPSFYPNQSLQCNYYILKHKYSLKQISRESFLESILRILEESKEVFVKYNKRDTNFLIHILEDIIGNSSDEILAFDTCVEEIDLINEISSSEVMQNRHSPLDLAIKKISLAVKMSYLLPKETARIAQTIDILERSLSNDCNAIEDETLRLHKKAELLFRLGVLYRTVNELDKTEQRLSRCLEITEMLYEKDEEMSGGMVGCVCYEMMFLYEQRGELENYHKFLTKALEQVSISFQNDKDFLDIYVNLLCRKAMFLLMTDSNDIDEMLRLAEYAYSLKSDDDMAKMTLAIVLNLESLLLLQNNEKQKALEHINKAIRLWGFYAELFETKGQILFSLGYHEDALHIWNVVLEMDPCFLDNHPDDSNLYRLLVEHGLIGG